MQSRKKALRNVDVQKINAQVDERCAGAVSSENLKNLNTTSIPNHIFRHSICYRWLVCKLVKVEI